MPTVSIKVKDLDLTSTGTSAVGLTVWKVMGGVAGGGNEKAHSNILVMLCIREIKHGAS